VHITPVGISCEPTPAPRRMNCYTSLPAPSPRCSPLDSCIPELYAERRCLVLGNAPPLIPQERVDISRAPEPGSFQQDYVVGDDLRGRPLTDASTEIPHSSFETPAEVYAIAIQKLTYSVARRDT
jgi:hypothetical protein